LKEHPDRRGKRTLTDYVYSALRSDILSGAYSAGASLVETRIAEELGVSRTPVREALRRLELEELVQSTPNKGMVVLGVTPKDIDDIYALRYLLEGLAARWAAERATPSHLVGLSENLDNFAFYVQKGGHFEKLAQLDTQFHDTLYASCQSAVLYHILATLHGHSSSARLRSLQTPNRAERTLQEHTALVSAIASGDAEAAERLAKAHITQANRSRGGDNAEEGFR
jgi:DNA-binding GntR family transcriptional regulator